MSKTASPLHIEWTPEWVRAVNIATGQTAEATSISGLGSILSGERSAIVGIARSQVFLKTTRLPKAAAQDLRHVLNVQLGQLFPLSATELAFDFVQTNDMSSEGCLTVIAAIRSEDLHRVRRDLQDAGVKSTRILPMSLAAPAVVSQAGIANAMVVESTSSGTAIDVVQNGILRFSRVVPADADVISEAKRTTSAAKVEELPIVAVGDIKAPNAIKASSNTLKLLDSAPPFSFELMEDREQQEKKESESRSRSTLMMATLALLVVGLACGSRQGAFTSVQKSEAVWKRSLTGLTTRQTAATKDAQDAMTVLNSVKLAFHPAQPLSDIIGVISDDLPKGAWLNEVNIERGKPADIRGTAKSSSDVAQFMSSLGSSPRFRDVHLVFANSATINKTPVVQFDISAVGVGNLPLPAAPKVSGQKKTTAQASVTQ